jgi:hypothetical protein
MVLARWQKGSTAHTVNLSIFGCQSVPPRFGDPHLRDPDHLAAGPDPLIHNRRETAADEASDQACVEAVCAEQRLRGTIAAYGAVIVEGAAPAAAAPIPE